MRAAQSHIQDPIAQNYLKSRGVSPKQIQEAGIGYFPEDKWPPYLKGSDEDTLSYMEWSSKGYRLRGKLVFPMHNATGLLRGIQIRSPDPQQKDYSKFYIGRSRVDAIFFGTPQAMPHIWEKREVYLCEGLFDYFPLQRAFPNTLCTGTANVSRRQIDFLLRYVDSVYVVFDADWGGNQFWKRFERDHGAEFESIQRIQVRGKDVSDMWVALGEERFQKSIRSHVLF